MRSPEEGSTKCRRVARVAVLALAWLLAACATAPKPAPAPASTATGEICLADLKAKGAFFNLAPLPAAGSGCVIDTPIAADGLAMAFTTPAMMSCALAERLMDFDLNLVQPTALRMFGRKVALMRHFGAYSCRTESSRRHDRLSQHAYGRAIDIAGFTLSDGTRIDVEKDWTQDDAHGRFLRAVAKGACAYFSVVLTPSYNSLHHDHLHLDIGPDRLCGIG